MWNIKKYFSFLEWFDLFLIYLNKVDSFLFCKLLEKSGIRFGEKKQDWEAERQTKK